MPLSLRRLLPAALLPAALLASTSAAGAQQADAALVARARAIHDRVIKLDTHVDFEPTLMGDTPPNYVTGLRRQVDLPKMKAGYNGIFFSIYVGQSDDLTPAGFTRAYDADIAKFKAVHKLAEQMAPDRIEIARTAADVRRIVKSGKLVALMGVENGYGIGTDVTNVKKFADYGARYLSLAHNGHNQLSDSNTGEANDEWKWHGVSPLGKQVVAEANKWGILLDISHPSKESNLWVMANSKAPVIASHSGVRALCPTASRDLDDEQLLALRKNGGVMQTVAFASYVNCAPAPSKERTAALAALAQEFSVPVAAVGRGGGAGFGGGRG
ncbi:MAG TPA: membrane dipeptidase, partial [Gemmatimonadaceae bacterium]|nr:membrane dipeptidase [Gemmatimonadaceae bacterium]